MFDFLTDPRDAPDEYDLKRSPEVKSINFEILK